MDNVIFEFYIGDTYTRDLIIEGYTDSIDEMYFTVKKNDLDKNFLLQKTIDDGITLTDVQYEEDGTTIKSRTYNILINAEDTEGLKVDVEYPFDIEIVTNKTAPSPNVKKTIVKGTFVLTSATTRRWDE